MVNDDSRMISFLQRAEVRLSTMHRIGGLFLNGAGLLIVLPIFFRDSFVEVVDLTRYHATGWSQIPLFLLLVITVIVPTLALFLLLRDVVDFYFAVQPTPHLDDSKRHAFSLRFALSAISLPSEGAATGVTDPLKGRVLEQQRDDSTTLDFVLPDLQADAGLYKRMLEESGRTIIPPLRRDICQNDERLSCLYAAFGLAGMVDRSLVQEVARAEASLVRHVLALRRLVLRYIKALVVLVWTIGVFLVFSKWVSVPPHVAGVVDVPDLRVSLALSAGFVIWSLITPFVIRFPIRWIHAGMSGGLGFDSTFRDKDLVSFELKVIVLSACAFGIASVLLAVAVTDSLHLEVQPYAAIVGGMAGLANAGYWIYRIRRAVS